MRDRYVFLLSTSIAVLFLVSSAAARISLIVLIALVCLWPAVLGMLARQLARPFIAERIRRSALQRPYLHIYDGDGSLYMLRYWLIPERRWLGGIRLHCIIRPDHGRDLHDHPFNARTFILSGWYEEQREDGCHVRGKGDTATLHVGEFHRITRVSLGGCWTLFVTGRRRRGWGFLVQEKNGPDSIFIPHEEYFK